MPSNIIKYIQRVRVFPVVWQCIAVGMVLFSVVNTMFMPEWGLNCCGSTQSIIAPIYFFREFDTNFWIVPTPEYYICHLYYDLIRKKEKKKKEKMGCVFSRQDINDVHSDTFSVINVDDQVFIWYFSNKVQYFLCKLFRTLFYNLTFYLPIFC